MTGKRMRGRSAEKLLNRGLLFKRIHELEGNIDIHNVESVVSHLRQSYQEYACKKLIPFTACVQHALGDYRTRIAAQQKEDDTENAATSTRSPKRSRLCSEGSSSSSFVVSPDEVAMDMESKSEINLMTASIWEAYSKPRLQRMPNSSNEEEGIQQENAQANGNANLTTTGGPWFRDFGGIKKIIAYLIRKVIFPFIHPERGASVGIRPCSGILLHGPPGCGKTMLANAIANEMGLPFYSILSTEIVSGITGASEEKLRELFEKARRTTPSVIFIDEVDAISSKRDSMNRGMEVRIVSEWINCMNENPRVRTRSEKKSSGVLVIGATNRPDAVDPSLRRPGRFDREIFLDAPDEQARREILSRLTEELDIDETVDLSKVARAASGYTGADLAELVSEAGQCALERVMPGGEMEISDELMKNQERMWWRQLWIPAESENLSISMIDFEAAAKLVQPSLKREGFSSIPSVKWEDVGGLDFLRKEFYRHII